MRIGTKLIRREDGKEFVVILPSHWSHIKSADGEEDAVKMLWADKVGERYAHILVSASKGFTYKEILE